MLILGISTKSVQMIIFQFLVLTRLWIPHRAARLCFLDAYSGYHQLRLYERDELKTVFITPFGCYCYTTMPFRLKNTGATYQRMMQNCLIWHIGKNVEIYVDYIVIKFSKGNNLLADLAETF